MNGYPGDPGFFGALKELPLLFKLFGGFVFIVVVGGFLYVILRGTWRWTANNASEVITSPVTVVDKRTEVWGGSGNSSASTDYYVTFEFDNGSRIELQVRGDKYGLIVVGDHGPLTYQGTRFKEFHR
ncbi:DUF2500 domain-containing protein [Paenibacillus rhizovicinus]|uniref:DUF2500 domain-containing protein n=1 Tax=Paenibacillus rhizovicinus TaxID=2704463 RepID=A0A6C0NTZ6_9BACL|nr:DUF2500 domain-containing protein [Paenibacillus rhizovicinus]QHW29690.1 DUF2500 domain-containing protein [Paenibacillus rhizovicinus]